MLDYRETLVPKKIFIVDDDLEKANQYRTILENNGFMVSIIFRFEEVIEKAIEAKPDLIFLDLMIPNRQGFILLNNLKMHPQTHNIPVIFLTKLGNMEFIQKGINMGAADYLLKATTNPDKLLQVTRKHLINFTARFHDQM